MNTEEKARIRYEHSKLAAHNAGRPGLPQGPCQCDICQKDTRAVPSADTAIRESLKELYEYESRRSSPDTAWETGMMTRARAALAPEPEPQAISKCPHKNARLEQSASGNESWFYCPDCGRDFDSIPVPVAPVETGTPRTLSMTFKTAVQCPQTMRVTYDEVVPSEGCAEIERELTVAQAKLKEAGL